LLLKTILNYLLSELLRVYCVVDPLLLFQLRLELGYELNQLNDLLHLQFVQLYVNRFQI
jgi:hypothetical protein